MAKIANIIAMTKRWAENMQKMVSGMVVSGAVKGV